MVRFSLIGAVIGGLAFWSFEFAIAVAAVLGVVTYISTLFAAFGQRAARAGLFLTLWAVLAMIMGTEDVSPLVVSGAFLVGGALAIVITSVRLALTSEDEADDEDVSVGEIDSGDVAPHGSEFARLRWASRGVMGEFAVLRAVAVMFSTLVGFWLFPGYEFWGAITVIIVLKPSTSQTASIAVQRTLGTALGAVAAVMAVQLFPGNQAYAVIGFATSAFFLVAFMNANYTIFAAFLTSTLVFAFRMVQADAFDGGVDRVLATIAGAAIAFSAVGVANLMIRRHAGS
jgi:hypothetical protein